MGARYWSAMGLLRPAAAFRYALVESVAECNRGSERGALVGAHRAVAVGPRARTSRCHRACGQPARTRDRRANSGRAAPEDLRRWWLQADGINTMLSCLPPSCTPCSTTEALSDRQMSLKVWRELGFSTASDGIAGEGSMPYLDLFLTIGDDHCGGYLYVDLREGPRRGGVGYCNGEENHDEPIWESTAHLLESVADAMDAGRPCMGDAWLPEPDPDLGMKWRHA